MSIRFVLKLHCVGIQLVKLLEEKEREKNGYAFSQLNVSLHRFFFLSVTIFPCVFHLKITMCVTHFKIFRNLFLNVSFSHGFIFTYN